VGENRVARLMRQNQLAAQRKKVKFQQRYVKSHRKVHPIFDWLDKREQIPYLKQKCINSD
jgi:hypothetical protein